MDPLCVIPFGCVSRRGCSSFYPYDKTGAGRLGSMLATLIYIRPTGARNATSCSWNDRIIEVGGLDEAPRF